MDRIFQNRQLVDTLKILIECYPEMRFSQILYVYDFVIDAENSNWKDEFYLEPEKLIERVNEAISKLK